MVGREVPDKGVLPWLLGSHNDEPSTHPQCRLCMLFPYKCQHPHAALACETPDFQGLPVAGLVGGRRGGSVQCRGRRAHACAQAAQCSCLPAGASACREVTMRHEVNATSQAWPCGAGGAALRALCRVRRLQHPGPGLPGAAAVQGAGGAAPLRPALPAAGPACRAAKGMLPHHMPYCAVTSSDIHKVLRAHARSPRRPTIMLSVSPVTSSVELKHML